MSEHVIAEEDELSNGERILVQIEGREIGIFNINNNFYAFLNWCPHQSGPCCEGSLTGTKTAEWDDDSLETSLKYIKEGEILNCPWHGWEYDIITGQCLSDKNVTLPSFPVRVKDGKIILELET
jgi:nitrite reductase/ring-hydroxylating ferredoxin subunit